ncbi:unnamed protein product [Parajaminaea phylloscopi]
MAAPSEKPIKRILCLHGWGSRPEVFRLQLRAVMKQLQPRGYEFVFLQAPQSLWWGKWDVMTTFGGPYYGWFTRETPANVCAAIRAVCAQVDLRDIDGIVGFSQGATLATLLASLAERSLLQPLCGGPTPRLRFVVGICPIRTRWAPGAVFERQLLAGLGSSSTEKHLAHNAAEPPPTSTPFLAHTPALYTVGLRDRYCADSVWLAESALGTTRQDCRFIRDFDSGHEVPRAAEAAHAIRDFVVAGHVE